MRSHRDGQPVVVCDGCYATLSAPSMSILIEGREYDCCGDTPTEAFSSACGQRIRETFPLPHRTPDEVRASEVRAAGRDPEEAKA